MRAHPEGASGGGGGSAGCTKQKGRKGWKRGVAMCSAEGGGRSKCPASDHPSTTAQRTPTSGPIVPRFDASRVLLWAHSRPFTAFGALQIAHKELLVVDPTRFDYHESPCMEYVCAETVALHRVGGEEIVPRGLC